MAATMAEMEDRVARLEASVKSLMGSVAVFGPDNLPPGIAFSKSFMLRGGDCVNTEVVPVREVMRPMWLALWASRPGVTVAYVRVGTLILWDGCAEIGDKGLLLRFEAEYDIEGAPIFTTPALGVAMVLQSGQGCGVVATVGGKSRRVWG